MDDTVALLQQARMVTCAGNRQHAGMGLGQRAYHVGAIGLQRGACFHGEGCVWPGKGPAGAVIGGMRY